ncbi:SDR family NAD(P)-dependent oxidoreductase [Streptomyces sporangiiformans]|uniref:Glucose 1-dehydrogenase n=1 Tax=Streptomyces sporangiiformans TaxID=2315329 RepID=A0A505DGS3_9ACTN|nr:glucose 1-dehydrogenase [Streptomyces sporangiiformans]TPQ22327.1 glucose 1-dehydrogenase [Streptomyces sporangiiformans]
MNTRPTSPAGPRLSGKTVLITGAARGQGASHAERLASEGARVLACDVLDEEGEATGARLQEAGLDVQYLHLDVTSPGDWTHAVEHARTATGRLDVLVNNAGIIHVNPLLEERVEDWNATLSVNTTGPLLGIQAAVPLMRAVGGGSIVNVASIFGVVGAAGYAAYCASKGALIALTKTAALELAADGIRVNAICPGGVSTPMNANEKEGGVIPQTPMGRRAHVREISGAVAFLASDDSSFTTGTEMIIDGGFLAH